MSNLADEITIPPKTKRGRHDDESENEDRLSDLPDCVLLHILSFVHAKHAVRTCILSTRWKHLRDEITIPPKTKRGRHDDESENEDRLSDLPDCALTSLTLSIYPKGGWSSGKTLFPKSLNLPALTSLDLRKFSFCASDNADRAEPFSAFTSLNSLVLRSCAVRDAQILSISSASLVNLTMTYTYASDFTKMELSAPSLCTLTFTGRPHQKLCGSSLSSVKQVNIDAYASSPWGEPPLVLLSWLLDLPNITSLTVTSSTLLVLALVPDLLKVKLLSLSNLKSLKVKLKPLSCEEPIFLEAVMLKNKSRKEASKIKKKKHLKQDWNHLQPYLIELWASCFKTHHWQKLTS